MSLSAGPDPLARFLAGHPCPTWCERAETGHPFTWDAVPLDDDDQARGALYQRCHRRTVAELDAPGARPSSVYLEQHETSADPADPTRARLHDLASTLLFDNGAVELDATNPGAHLRRIVGQLLNAADQLDHPNTNGAPQ